MGGWTLWMVDIYICTKAINALWVDSWLRPKSNGRGENHLGRRVPSSQTSLYRSLWGECHVHRPLFTGRPNGLGVQGKCQVYRSLFTDPPLQVPSLPISLYRSLPIGRWKKKKKKIRAVVILAVDPLSINQLLIIEHLQNKNKGLKTVTFYCLNFK